MEHQLNQDELPERERVHLLFALGKAYEDNSNIKIISDNFNYSYIKIFCGALSSMRLRDSY